MKTDRDLDECKKCLLQNAVFRPKRKIYALRKLARIAALTVLANFFFDLFFKTLFCNRLVPIQQFTVNLRELTGFWVSVWVKRKTPKCRVTIWEYKQKKFLISYEIRNFLVETAGLEPVTSCV